MGTTKRRSFLRAGIASFPLALLGQAAQTPAQPLITRVPAEAPRRHLHHSEEEWFYVIQGDYIFEIGTERFRLTSGDSVLGPRATYPHAPRPNVGTWVAAVACCKMTVKCARRLVGSSLSWRQCS